MSDSAETGVRAKRKRRPTLLQALRQLDAQVPACDCSFDCELQALTVTEAVRDLKRGKLVLIGRGTLRAIISSMEEHSDEQ